MVDIFTKQQFEAALPVSKTGDKLWKPLGLMSGEKTYIVPIVGKPRFGIMVRSSVRFDGKSAGTGEDSIRCWIVAHEPGYPPWGSKISKYITRTPGWDRRLIDTLKKLYKMALAIKDCEHCKQPMKVFKVKKEGPNHGKIFLKCDCALGRDEAPKFMEIS